MIPDFKPQSCLLDNRVLHRSGQGIGRYSWFCISASAATLISSRLGGVETPGLSHGEETPPSFLENLFLTRYRHLGYAFCMDRTITVQLNPTPEQAHILKATFEQHTACFNAVAHEGFTTACSNGVELHKRTY